MSAQLDRRIPTRRLPLDTALAAAERDGAGPLTAITLTQNGLI